MFETKPHHKPNIKTHKNRVFLFSHTSYHSQTLNPFPQSSRVKRKKVKKKSKTKEKRKWGWGWVGRN